MSQQTRHEILRAWKSAAAGMDLPVLHSQVAAALVEAAGREYAARLLRNAPLGDDDLE